MNRIQSLGNQPRRSLLLYGAIGAIVVLIIAGLLLPPISLLERVGATCSGTTLDTNNPAITTEDGLTIALADAAHPVTLKLATAAQNQYEKRTAGDELAAAQDAQPVQLALRSPIYQINPCSSDPVSASIAIQLPNDAADETYDLYAWDGQQWSWLGAYVDPQSKTAAAQVSQLPKTVALFQTASVAPAVSTQVTPGQMLPAGIAKNLTEAYVAGWTLADDGSLLATAGELPKLGKAKEFALVRSAEAAPVRKILASEEATQAHLDALAELAGRSTFAGLAIDYRGLPADEREAFTHFVRQLKTRLAEKNKQLAVVLPAPAIDVNGAPDTAGYDWPELGAAVDIVQADFGQDPANYLTGKAGYALVDWAPTQVSRYKFQPIFSVASLNTIAGGKTTEVPFAAAIKPLGQFSITGSISITPGAPFTLTLGNPTQVSDFDYDAQTRTYRFKYVTNGAPIETVVKTARSLANQLSLLLPRHMRGVVITGLEGDVEPVSLASALIGYRQQSVPQDLPSPLDMRWEIMLANGKVVSTTRPITDTTFVWTAPDVAGPLSIKALVGSQLHGSSQLEIASSISDTLALSSTATTTATLSSTSTVTTTAIAACPSSKYLADVTVSDGTKVKNKEQFKKTWKVSNDNACDWPADTALVFVSGERMGTPDTVKVGKVAPGAEVEVSVDLTAPEQYGNYTGLWQLRSGQSNFGTLLSTVIQAGDPPAGAVTAGASGPIRSAGNIGGFEIGGQVNSFSRPDLMKRAGMTWVKVQSHGGDESGAINVAHANGFKILLSVLGDRGEAMDPNYQGAYAADLAKMAAAGADAIEVWNEPNIDREWPAGQINGANYTQLLAKAYNAIKAANPNTLVVSAAPAPTGFWGAAGCADSGCNDDAFMHQMAAAGAANYMDCVGAHHNSGTTSPSVSSGRPEGNHYSWYFLPTLNLYFGAFGGARKVCFTELGYLSPEGYPSLRSTAPAFAWAENTTVAQQAQWLAEAASISGSSGKVRLMIVFNVDFDYYGSDPQAGYAIIRQGGSCPACDALGAVMR